MTILVKAGQPAPKKTVPTRVSNRVCAWCQRIYRHRRGQANDARCPQCAERELTERAWRRVKKAFQT